MTWKSTLADINSVDIDDLHEYNSRPNEKVLDLLYKRKHEEIIIYGATGKWMSDLTEMILRAIRDTGTASRKVHIISRFRNRGEFDKRFSKYSALFGLHEIDLVNNPDLNDVPSDAQWIIYGVGYKFRTTETEEEYARLCRLYGNDIPRIVINHHKHNADIVVIGSANGVDLTRVDDQAKDDAPLLPKESNLYGISIRDKENVVKEILEKSMLSELEYDNENHKPLNPPLSPFVKGGNQTPPFQKGGRGDFSAKNPSKAVILRGGYMTDFTYGGLETPVLAVLNDKEIDLAKLTYFNIIGHRDANIYVILSVDSASNPVTTLNLSGHTVDIRQIVDMAGKAFGKTIKYAGKPAELHLLIDSSKIENLYGQLIDSLSDLINGQIYWIKNRGYSKALNHHVGETM
jgi:hypothetical protein